MSRLRVEGLAYLGAIDGRFAFAWASNDGDLHDRHYIGNAPRRFIDSMLNQHRPVHLHVFSENRASVFFDGMILFTERSGGSYTSIRPPKRTPPLPGGTESESRLWYCFMVQGKVGELPYLSEDVPVYIIIEELIDMEVTCRRTDGHELTDPSKVEPIEDSRRTVEIAEDGTSARAKAVLRILEEKRRNGKYDRD